MKKTASKGTKNAREYLSWERKVLRARFSRQPDAALLFPAPYPTGIANLGFLRIWERLNAIPDFTCDRAFWDPRSKEAPVGLETGLPLRAFPLVFISSSFELDLIEVVRALLAAGIEPEAKLRGMKEPLIVLGGLAPTLNPAPWEPMVDLALLGEGEEAVEVWVKIYQQWRGTEATRDELREASATLPFAWIPSHPERAVAPARYGAYTDDPAVSSAVHPEGHFGDCWLVELTRGCPRQCRFCALCGVYPARFTNFEAILSRLEATDGLGAEKVGLVGGAVGDHPGLKTLIRQLLDRGRTVTVSSLRIERTDAELIELLSQAGLETLTVAPEAGSETLRFRLGKKASDEDLVALVKLAGQSNLKKLRFYFLIGLPDPEDPKEIVQLIQRLRKEAPRRLKLDLSVSSFIPKPGTPWEQAPFAPVKELEKVKTYLKGELRHLSGVKVEFEATQVERRAALLSRGEGALGEAVIRAVKMGRPLEQELRLAGLDLAKLFDLRGRTKDSLPWGKILLRQH